MGWIKDVFSRLLGKSPSKIEQGGSRDSSTGGEFVSYAQNFEDVMLWRALKSISEGFYIDIGAQHPVVDSVSLAFYERGWKGIHVEPVRYYADLLRTHRPDEVVLEVLVGEEQNKPMEFYEVVNTGLSTARLDIASEHQSLGFEIKKKEVSSISMDALLELAPEEDIHWLKIDVEGYERKVLQGWRESKKRPWVVVVEATYPNTQIDTYEEWEDLVLSKGYSLVYLDGLNRFYVHKDHAELIPAFKYPPNVFDGFRKWRSP